MAIGKLPDSGDDSGDEGGESLFAEINITPLTDVFLVMVIIFMLSALAVKAEADQKKKQIAQQQEQSEIDKRTGLRVNLPPGQAQEIDPSKDSLVLVIPLNGDVNIGGKLVPDGELDNLLRRAFTQNKLTQVVIKADKGCAHGRVVNVMERAKSAGLTRLAIATGGG
jgi:biopolymer transport protein ExbD